MTIIYDNQKMPVASGLAVREVIPDLPPNVLAMRIGGQVLELSTPIPHEGELFPLTLADEEGRRIYERSVRFVLLLAIRNLMPGQRVRIEYSVGGGVLLRLPGRDTTDEDAQKIEAEMRRIADLDLPFTRQDWPLEKAIAHFSADGQEDKITLFRRRKEQRITMYHCGGMWEYFYGAMAASTGQTSIFALRNLPGRGLALLLPTAERPDAPADFIDRPKHLAVFAQSERWCDILGIQNAPDLHDLMENGQFRQFIRVNEALHDKAIADIAEAIAAGGKRIVLIAGPSSSGKTTFTGRLGIHLRVLGLQPIQLSLDDYYLDRDAIPPQPDGTVDLESLDTIDVPLFRQQMARLMAGEEVEIPRFSFQAGKRKKKGVSTRLQPGQPVLIEGIHGLNPALIEGLDEAVIHRVFVSALTCIDLDDHNRIRTTDVRLLRRIVRDNQFRGTPPSQTLSMWPSVRRGEETWIFPHQERADSMFNTALHYELPVLRHFAYDLLQAIPNDNPQRITASRLIKMLDYFPVFPTEMLDEIPPLSLLREFVGGCTLEKV